MIIFRNIIISLMFSALCGCTSMVNGIGKFPGQMSKPSVWKLENGALLVKLEPNLSIGTYSYPASVKSKRLVRWVIIPKDDLGGFIELKAEKTETTMPENIDKEKLKSISIIDFKEENGEYMVYRPSFGDYSRPAYFCVLYDKKDQTKPAIQTAIKVQAPYLDDQASVGTMILRGSLFPFAIITDACGVIIATATLPITLPLYITIGRNMYTEESYDVLFKKEDYIESLRYNDGFRYHGHYKYIE